MKALTAVLLESRKSLAAADDVRSPLPGADWIKVIQEREARARVASGQNEWLKSEPKR